MTVNINCDFFFNSFFFNYKCPRMFKVPLIFNREQLTDSTVGNVMTK